MIMPKPRQPDFGASESRGVARWRLLRPCLLPDVVSEKPPTTGSTMARRSELGQPFAISVAVTSTPTEPIILLECSLLVLPKY